MCCKTAAVNSRIQLATDVQKSIISFVSDLFVDQLFCQLILPTPGLLNWFVRSWQLYKAHTKPLNDK
jgi:hypothetical protein